MISGIWYVVMSRLAKTIWSGLRRMARRALMVCLSLSAYEFQRGYWFGGVLLLLSFFLSNPTAFPNPSRVVRFFAGEWVSHLAIAAIVAPPVFTAISEIAFWAIRQFGRSEDVRSLQKYVPARERLVPIEFRSGGVKQVIGCYSTTCFKSFFFGYAPYSVKVPPRKATQLGEHTRGVVLATTGDALDFKEDVVSFRAIRVCDACWILCRATE